MGGERVLVALSSPSPIAALEVSLLFSHSFYFHLLFWLAVLTRLSDSWDPGFSELPERLSVTLPLFFLKRKVSSGISSLILPLLPVHHTVTEVFYHLATAEP